ncbi:MAG: ABC transporter permease subunit, partial [Candidatus Eisenbacteria bacterium]|nr:ABC transporter permease subunit [Candidatus Eisenbacteria bacterium]
MAGLCAGVVCLLCAASAAGAADLVVGSKNFAESRLLGEIFAQLIEEHTELTVERRLGLAGTQVCFEALRTGAIDIYPEYTGTGLVTILKAESQSDATGALNTVRREFRARWDLLWLAPLGFENAYEVAVPSDLAERHDLQTISDLAKISRDLTAGFGYEFVERPDGLPGLRGVYDLEFAAVKQMQQALKYQAAGARRIDCLDVYTTDGRLLVHDLVVLRDDKRFFPPYEAAALVRADLLDRHPEVAEWLGLLTNAFDAERMRSLNLRLQEHKEEERVVAADALDSLGLRRTAAPPAKTAVGEGLFPYMWDHRRELLHRLVEHLGMSAMALALGVLLAVPLGLALERRRDVAESTIRVVGTSQTVPSIALLAFMIPLLGVGAMPAVVALWIYSLFPILRNTYTGVRDASPEAVEAAGALGMTKAQILFRVRLPLAAPVLMAGVRTAAVITVGTATLAAFIGAGGLGVPIVAGLQLADTTIILSGALPAAVLALAVDGLLALVEAILRPKGLERQAAG